jgi:hypothetical protein
LLLPQQAADSQAEQQRQAHDEDDGRDHRSSGGGQFGFKRCDPVLDPRAAESAVRGAADNRVSALKEIERGVGNAELRAVRSHAGADRARMIVPCVLRTPNQTGQRTWRRYDGLHDRSGLRVPAGQVAIPALQLCAGGTGPIISGD